MSAHNLSVPSVLSHSPDIPNITWGRVIGRLEKPCSHCFAKEAAHVCSGCRNTRYCSKECQKADWKKGHKNTCKEVQQCKKDAVNASVSTIPDALAQLISTTESGETEKIVGALCAIADLCSEANLKNQNKAVKTGCPEQIIKTLAKFPAHAEMAEEGLRSFNNMACNHLENKASLARVGAIPCVVSALKAHPTHRGVVEWGVVAVQNMSSGPNTNATLFGALGVIPIVLQNLRRYLTDPDTAIVHKALGAVTHLTVQQDGSDENGLKIAEAGGVELVLDALERVDIEFESHAYMSPGIVTAFTKNRHLAKVLNQHVNRAAKLVVKCMNRHAESSARMAVVTFTAIQSPSIGALLMKPHDTLKNFCYQWAVQYMSMGVADLVRKCILAHGNDPQYGTIVMQLGTQILNAFTGSEK